MKKLALCGVAVGALMAAGVAQAEPLKLSAAQMDQVSAGGFFDVAVRKQVLIDKLKRIDIQKFVNAQAFVVGHLADAEASAQAFGSNTFAETLTIADADAFSGFSGSFSESDAAAYP